MALNELDHSKLELVESHINENRHLLTELKCCYSDVYRSQPEFQFLPGHRATILGLKNQINKMKENRNQKRKALGSKRKPDKSIDELQTQLIISLDKFSTKHGFPANLISDKNIVDWFETSVEGQTVYKCGFSCVFCSKVVPMQHKSYWMTSNATKHIKTHNPEGYQFEVEDIVV